MRRPRAVLACLAAVLAISVPASVAISGPAAAAIAQASSTTPISASVTAFQAHVKGQLRSYLGQYADRLSEADRAQADAIIASIDTQLGQIAGATAAAERLAATKASRSSRQAAANAAVRQFDAGYAASTAALAQMTPILQPKLSLFEALGAKSTFDREMAAYAGLGTRIKALAAAQRK